MHTFEEIQNSVQSIVFKPKNKKDNFFDIGTRGFYENPFTEVLAYIISPESCFKSRGIFIKCFLESFQSLSPEVIESFLLELKVQTQHTTLSGNYIDLLIFNSKYILVFENKVEHWLANPIDDYEKDIKTRYSHLSPYFFVLSYNQVNTPNPWENVIIGDSFSSIKNSLPHQFNDKWDFFVQDFLNHYLQTNLNFMNHDEFEFYANNFSQITAANNQVNIFITEVVEKIQLRFPIDAIKRTAQHSAWGSANTKAVRLYPFDSNDNIVLVFREDGKFSVTVYYYQNPQTHLQKLQEIVGQTNYKNWKEGAVSCFTRLDGKEFTKVDDLVDECVAQLMKMKEYYG